MRRVLTAIGVSATLAVLAVAPAAATHAGIHPTFKQTRYYFHCVGGDAMKLQNASAPAPFDTTAPTRSFLAGAGCGTLDPGALVNTGQGAGEADAVFSGKVTGNIKNMTVELHVLGHTNYSALLPADVNVWLTVDGEDYLIAVVASIPWAAQGTGLTRMIQFSITDLGWTKDVRNEQGELIDVLYGGLVGDDGDGVTERDVELTVGLYFSDEVGAWVWDATEVTSGITVNDATPAAKKVSADQLPPE